MTEVIDENVNLSSHDTWDLIDLYFNQESLARHQIEPYDHFIEHDIPDLIRELGHVTVKHENLQLEATFQEVRITRPMYQETNGFDNVLYPGEARLRGLTYAASLLADLVIVERDIQAGTETRTVHPRVMLCEVPMMVKSKFCNLHGLTDDELRRRHECPYEMGGYFVISGVEKVVLAQERIAGNTLFVFSKPEANLAKYEAEVHSVAEGNSTKKISVRYLRRSHNLVVALTFTRTDIPLLVVFRALGVLDDNLVAGLMGCSSPDELRSTFDEAHSVNTQVEALAYISRNLSVTPPSGEDKLAFIERVLRRDLFPHVGPDFNHKAVYLGYMVKRLRLVLSGQRQPDDRDHFGKKRVDFTGSLLSGLFKTLFKRTISDMAKTMSVTAQRRGVLSAHEAFTSVFLTNGLKYSLATGKWGDQKKFAYTRVGVSQPLNRYNFAATVSHLRRINTPVGRDGKLAKPRLLHSTQWGIACPSETPEGQTCGLVKNLAFMATATIKSSWRFIQDYINSEKLCSDVTFDGVLLGLGRVFVNGKIVGLAKCIKTVHTALVSARRRGLFRQDVSISYNLDDNELTVVTDHGRICRPVLVVDGDRLVLDRNILRRIQSGDVAWNDLIADGIVEYIDAEESECLRIAQYPHEVASGQYTHCEIHPAMILGVCASCIPFPDHNQAPRNTYQAAMGKQSIGTFLTNYHLRMDTVSNILFYPQKPLVTTKPMKYLHGDTLPTGQNAIVAIACYGGYNQEDSVIMNQSAIDRGLFRSMGYHTYIDEERRGSRHVSENFERPDPDKVIRARPGSFDHLDDDGMAAPNTVIEPGGVIIGKTMSSEGEERRRDVSTRVRHLESGVVDHVVVTSNRENNKVAKVRVRSVRIPQMGDKFASRHGQKGTVGITYRQEDMPFAADGTVPDLIINPHAIPSRMTIGHLIECVLGKVCTLAGEEGDGTAFTGDITVEAVADELKKYGYDPYGYEELFNGFTGEKMKAKIFIGPTYYQRLKHMVDDKIHSRSHGPLQVLTRQPVEGRSREGGLRFGEMERDSLHGDTLVTCQMGVSVPISKLDCYLNTSSIPVLSYNTEKFGIEYDTATNFLKKKPREIVKVTLEDGTVVKSTPEHEFFADGKWVHAKDTLGKRVTAGVTGCSIDPHLDLTETKCSSYLELRQKLAYYRLLGYVLTDGHLSESTCQVFAGTLLDANEIVADIKLITGQDVTPRAKKNTLDITVPVSLRREYLALTGIATGRRMASDLLLPDVVSKSDFPRCYLREFLGGLFGGDGGAPRLLIKKNRRASISGLTFHQSKDKSQLKGLERLLTSIQELLFKFEINCTLRYKLRKTKSGKEFYEGILSIPVSDVRKFHDTINYRYCAHKIMRLSASVRYLHLRDKVLEQHKAIANLIPKRWCATQEDIEDATEKYKENNFLLHSPPCLSYVKSTQVKTRPTIFELDGAEEFFFNIGAHSFFNVKNGKSSYSVSRDAVTLPVMKLKVVNVEFLEEHQVVYDIQVTNNQNFLANGTVAHNCLISHGGAAFLRDRLFDNSDAYETFVCSDCGLIAVADPKRKRFKCTSCKSGANVDKVALPYASKLLFQELLSMGICARIRLKDD